jgi:hypothetical protein
LKEFKRVVSFFCRRSIPSFCVCCAIARQPELQQIRKRIHTYIHAYVYPYVYIPIHIRTCIRTYIRTYTHTHTYIHTYIHTNMHMYILDVHGCTYVCVCMYVLCAYASSEAYSLQAARCNRERFLRAAFEIDESPEKHASDPEER